MSLSLAGSISPLPITAVTSVVSQLSLFLREREATQVAVRQCETIDVAISGVAGIVCASLAGATEEVRLLLEAIVQIDDPNVQALLAQAVLATQQGEDETVRLALQRLVTLVQPILGEPS